MSPRSLAAPLIAALFLTACAPDEPAGECLDRDLPNSGDVSALVDGNTAFAIDLYGALATEPGNLFMSPFSISAALGMTWAGARGETAEQMSDVLHVALEDALFHQSFGALADSLNSEGRGDGCGYELALANRIFGQVDYPWEPDFLAIAEQDWHAPLEEVDFITDPEAARLRVNDWAAEQTHDRILDLLPPGSIDDSARMVLANAIYFMGTWAEQFDPDLTAPADFWTSDTDSVTADLMTQEGTFKLASDELASVLQLPYTGDEQSMLIVLPHERSGLAAVEEALTVEWLDGMVASLSEVDELIVSLPKFELTQGVRLNDVLVALGMELAFDPDLADFTGLADAPDGNLYIQHVFHKAFVAVDELGTEAAAATAVVVGTESAGPDPFRADHPFLFGIRDDLTGSLLFLGRVSYSTDSGE